MRKRQHRADRIGSHDPNKKLSRPFLLSLSLYYSYILYHSSHACTRSVQIVYILQLQSKISRLPDAIDQQMTLLQFNSGELLGDGRS